MDNSFIEIIQNQLVTLLQKKQQKFQWNQLRQDAPSSVKITVSEEGKMFTREEKEDKGLLWYKNLNFPPINITLKSTKTMNFPQSLKCQITVVKLRNNEKPEQSPLIGDTEQQFMNSQAGFAKLKFTQTSHKCGMCLFSFVITIFNDSEDASLGEAGLWSIFYSSPFEIEARQRTLPERVAVQKTTNWSLFNPFLPIFLDKQYEAKNKEGVNQIIGSDIDGMFMYLRSPIIRHKVFHPIFLLLKFRDSVRLFYNRNLIKIQEGENLFSKLQRQIFEMLWQHDKPVFLDENKLFILTLKRKDSQIPLSQNEKQIIKYLKSLNGPIVTFMAPNFENFPKNFTEIKYNEKLIEQYREGFLSMALINFKRSKMNESEKNFLLEFDAVSQQNNEFNQENNNNCNQKGNQQFFAQTIISINNKYCCNRAERLKYQCISHKNLSNSPQCYKNETLYMQRNSNLTGKRDYQEFQSNSQRDDLDISEVREQLRKLTKKNEDKNQKNIQSPQSTYNPTNQNNRDQVVNNQIQENLHKFQQITENKKSNKTNKNNQSQQLESESVKQNNTQQVAAINIKKEKTPTRETSERDLNKSSSPIFQSLKQESIIQTQNSIPPSNISSNSSQNTQIIDFQNSDKISTPLSVSLNSSNSNPSSLFNQSLSIPIGQMGVPNPINFNQPKNPNQFYQMPLYIYPQQTQLNPYYYMQGQPQALQTQVNNYYQDLIQKQQQIILEQQKKLEQKDAQ